MTYRHVYEGGTWKNYTLSNDAENRLTTVTGPVTANFKYDGDSKRVRATINGGLDTVFIGNYFEWNVATQTKRTYYYAGATRIAMREGSTDPQWILSDHLGSTSKMVSYQGADSGGQWYKAWGETRLQTGAIPTKYQYTGQYNQVIIGLYYYGARWYDPALGRFTQPDNIIPGPANSQSWDRYSYVLNNPLKFTDPSGHDPHWCEGSAWSSSCELRYYYAMSPDPKPVVDDYLQAYDISAPSDLIDSQKYASAMAAAIKGDYFFWTYGSQYGFDSPFDAFLKTHGLINILIDSNRTDCQTVQHTISCGPNAITLGTIMHEYFHVMDKYYAESVTAQEWCKYPDGLGCMASNWLPREYYSDIKYTTSAYNCPTCLAHPPTLFGYDFTEAFANAGETWVLSASGIDPTGGFANNTYGDAVSGWMTDNMTKFFNSMFK